MRVRFNFYRDTNGEPGFALGLMFDRGFYFGIIFWRYAIDFGIESKKALP
jgi:hypothetical protein